MFFGLAASVWILSLRLDGVEQKRPFDRRGDRRAGERAVDGHFIMLPAFWVVLGFGVSGHAGKSR